MLFWETKQLRYLRFIISSLSGWKINHKIFNFDEYLSEY